jgi:hypothetical protein
MCTYEKILYISNIILILCVILSIIWLYRIKEIVECDIITPVIMKNETVKR